MTAPAFNPEVAALAIPFDEELERAGKAERSLRFGPIAVEGEVTFIVDTVTDLRTGRELPSDAFRLKAQNPDGEQHWLVSLSFDGDHFTQHFKHETEPNAFLERLKGGLLELSKELPDKSGIAKLTLQQATKLYNAANDTLVGTYEPLYAALTNGTATLAIQVIVPEIQTEGCEPATVTLYVQPRPKISQG
jgi:hypothetical protein